ncbi:MAG TPA: ATP-binding protein, partial [Terriglobia bacterium]|nr:ATP-binding protein [Terriglobia bacterium]
AHDFNNILLAMTGNTRLVSAELPPAHPAQESLAEVLKAGARATDLVRRILSFSRPAEQEREVIQLQPVVLEALKLVRSTLPAMIEIRADFAPGLPPVAVNSTQVHQVIVNLATNASHAIGEKPGLIEVRLEGTGVGQELLSALPGLKAGDYVRLSVTDNGCGMDRATQERIFDPFFTTKPQGKGTGLGLSVVHGIMKSHGGGVTVYSEPGKGTSFRLYFPSAAGQAESRPAEEPQAERRRGEHVLYIDDESALVRLAKRGLERLGYRVTGFTDPLAALAEFRRRPREFDAVVTDLSMPGMSGFGLAEELLVVRPDVPIIATSGYVRPEDQDMARRLGVRNLIPKPDSLDELSRALDAVFRGCVEV